MFYLLSFATEAIHIEAETTLNEGKKFRSLSDFAAFSLFSFSLSNRKKHFQDYRPNIC
jgi:hypothetical protein